MILRMVNEDLGTGMKFVDCGNTTEDSPLVFVDDESENVEFFDVDNNEDPLAFSREDRDD